MARQHQSPCPLLRLLRLRLRLLGLLLLLHRRVQPLALRVPQGRVSA